MIVSGLDVHKDSVFCATFNGKSYGEVLQFGTLTCEIQALGEHLKKLGIKRVAMESTGIYWVPIWNILEKMGFDLMLVNAFLIKQMPGRKSDVKDAQWIARLLHRDMLRGSLVLEEKVRALRCYCRFYRKAKQQTSSLLLRMERTLEMCNIRITSFSSKIDSKSVIQVIQQIIAGQTDSAVLVQFIHGRIINRHPGKIKASLEGIVPEYHRYSLQLLMEGYQKTLGQIQALEEQMLDICNECYQQELSLLRTIPGIDTLAAITFIAEAGADMQKFETSNKLSAWLGLRPRNDESAGKLQSTATTKGNKYLRTVLVQAAWAASRMKEGYFKETFTRLAMRKSSKKALVAVARKLCVICWNVLYFKQPYNPILLPSYDPKKMEAKRKYHQRELDRLNKLFN